MSIILEKSIHLKCLLSDLCREMFRTYLFRDNLLETQVMVFRNFQVIVEYLILSKVKTILEWCKNIFMGGKLISLKNVRFFSRQHGEKWFNVIIFQLSRCVDFGQGVWSTREFQTHFFYIALFIVCILMLWGLISGIILTKLFRNLVRKQIGVHFDRIKLNPLLFKISITNVVAYPSSSPLVQQIILSVLPSADVATEPTTTAKLSKDKSGEDVSFSGSKVTVSKVVIHTSVYFHWFVILLTKKNDKRMNHEETHRNEEDKIDMFSLLNDNEIGLNGIIKFHSLKKLLKLIHGWIKLVGIVPQISVHVKDVQIEVDKAYVAPEPDFPIDLYDSLPAAILKDDYTDLKLPTFSTLSTCAEEEISAANTFSDLLDNWLDSYEWIDESAINSDPNAMKASMRSVLDGSMYSSDADDVSFASSKGSTQVYTAISGKLNNGDPANTLLQRTIRAFLSALTITVENFNLVVSGAEAKTVTEARASLSPVRANKLIAETPKKERALSVVGFKFFSLSFEGDNCNAIITLKESFVKVGFPLSTKKKVKTRTRRFRDKNRNLKKTKDSIKFQWHDLVHSYDICVGFSGFHHIVAWATSYDHLWPDREIGVTISMTGNRSIHLSPKPLHTVLAHWDDYVDPNSPFNEWSTWCKKIHLSNCDTKSDERLEYQFKYRQFLKQTKKWKHRRIIETSNILQDKKFPRKSFREAYMKDSFNKSETLSNEKNTFTLLGLGQMSTSDHLLNMSALEHRMTRREIIFMRYVDVIWDTPRKSRALKSFLKSSNSTIILGPREEEFFFSNVHAKKSSVLCGDTENNCFDLHEEYTTTFNALLALLQMKSSALAASFSFEFKIDICSVEIPSLVMATNNEQPEDLYLNSVHFSSPGFDINSAASVSSILYFENIKFKYHTRLELLSETISIATDTTLGQKQSVQFSLDKLRWDPKESLLPIPKFDDDSFCGLLYEKSKDKSNSKVMVDIKIESNPLSPDLTIEGSITLAEIVFILIPLPVHSILEALIQIADFPVRDMKHEQETLGIFRTLDNDDNMLDESNTEFSTIINGAKANLSIKISNCSVIFLTDGEDLNLGSVSLSVEEVSLLLNSGQQNERLKMSISKVALDMCRPIGSSHEENFMELMFFGFKSLLIVDYVDFLYEAQPLQLESMLLSELITTSSVELRSDIPNQVVCVEIEVFVGPNIELNIAPIYLISINGFVNSLMGTFCPSADEAERKQMEEDQDLLKQQNIKTQQDIMNRKELLREIWQIVDADKSDSLDHSEVRNVVKHVFSETLEGQVMESQAAKLTERELARETNLLILLLDPKYEENISFQELDELLHNIILQESTSTTNKPDGVNSNKFVDAFGVLYYEDMREYSATAELYRLTGTRNTKIFPPPSTWRQGTGIELFWELYEKETSCAKYSLNGQEILTVQSKLVRALCNYEFAKFCWKSLVYPELQTLSDSLNDIRNVKSNHSVNRTAWMLDADPKLVNRTGALEKFTNYIYNSEEKKLKKTKMRKKSLFWYDVKLLCKLDGVTLNIGSAHRFTRNIFEFEVSLINISINSLMDFHVEKGIQFVSFTKDRQTADISNTVNIEQEQKSIIRGRKRAHTTMDYSRFNSGLDLHLEFVINSKYLNSTHATIDTFIEPFPTFVKIKYIPISSVTDDNEDEECSTDGKKIIIQVCCVSLAYLQTALVCFLVFSAAVEFQCPLYLNINVSPSIFPIYGLVVDLASNLSPQIFFDEAMNEHIKILRGFWDGSATYGSTSTLKSASVSIVLNSFFDSFKTTNQEESFVNQKRASEIMKLLSLRPDECIKFEDLELAAQTVVQKSNHIFDIVGNVSVINHVGEVIKFFPHDVDMHEKLEVIIQPGRSKTYNKLSSKDKYDNRICISVQNFKPIDDIGVNVYYKSIILLKPTKRDRRRQNRVKKSTASGFEPCIVIDPVVDKYDNLRIELKSCIKIEARTPIDFRVLQVNVCSVDITGKNILSLLRDHCEYSTTIFEKYGVSIGSLVSLPLTVTSSSYVHVLQLRDENFHSWRMPIPLTKEFLHNTLVSNNVALCYDRCGISIQRNRLNINRPKSSKKSVLKTAWETVCWQLPQDFDDYDEMKCNTSFAANGKDSINEGNAMDDSSSATSSDAQKSITIDSSIAFSASDRICIAEDHRLNGMDMRYPMFIQVAQSNASTLLKEEGSLIWSSPVQINLNKLRAGGNKSGANSLPLVSVKLGDEAVFFIHVTVGRYGLLADCFAKYCIVNKTGMKMMFDFSGWDNRPFDSGVGGIPILANCFDDKKVVGSGRREMSICPLESTVEKVSNVWWDTEASGRLIINPPRLKLGKNVFAGWCDPINVDVVGTPHEIYCKDVIFGVSVQSLTGIFQRSNLISISPRFILKNDLVQTITVLPLQGSLENVNAILQDGKIFNTKSYWNQLVNLEFNQSTIIYKFDDVSNYGISEGERFICIKVNRENDWKDERWHLIAANGRGTDYFMQRTGGHYLVSGIVSVERVIDGAKLFLNIKNCDRPPYRIENRSNEFYIQFMQDDHSDCEVLELPPMCWCSFTWDNPYGKHKLKFIALDYECSLACSREKEKHEFKSTNKDNSFEFMDDEFSQESSSVNDSVSELGSHQTLKENESHNSSAKKLFGDTVYKNKEYLFKRRLYLSSRSRVYDPSKPGSRKKLPCPNSSRSHLFAEVRIMQGCRILSFNDSGWRIDQIQRGLLKSGGNFKNIMINAKIEGIGIHLLDDFPREICSVNIRDLTVQKLSGKVEVTTRLRHLQIDAMSKSARYPIILSQKPLGIDERDSPDDFHSPCKDKTVFYWLQKTEKPPPMFEATVSYIPQNNMLWIPKVQVLLSPIKLNVEVMYFLKMADLILNSLPTNISGNDMDISYALMQFTSKIVTPLSRTQDSDSTLCYVEKFHINSTWIELELDIRSEDGPKKSQQHEMEEDPMLALNAMGRSSKSALSAGLISWVTDVAAVFAHVSPKFVFDEIQRVDYFSHPLVLFEDLASTYTSKIIYQSYKVLFSMHLIGNPTRLLDEYKNGVTDLFLDTKSEVFAGGKKGFGKGFRSFLKSFIGGTCYSISIISGGLADILLSVTSNELTSQLLMPDKTQSGEPVPHVVEGVFQGTSYLTTSLAHGLIGFVGNPYRGIKKGSFAAFGKGVYSGTSGLVIAPFIGALGFTAKISEGVSENTRIFEYNVIESRCRPTRIVSWGGNIGSTVLPYLKEFGIRIHTVRYMKPVKKNSFNDKLRLNGSNIKRSDLKKARQEEREMTNPASLYFSMTYGKSNRYESSLTKPKVYHKETKHLKIEAIFEHTVFIRASDLQLSEPIMLNLCEYGAAAAATTKRKAIAQCTLSIGDIYSSLLRFAAKQQDEKKLSMTMWDNKYTDDSLRFKTEKIRNKGGLIKDLTDDTNVATPSIQEFSLMCNYKKRKFENINIVDAIANELSGIKNTIDSDENEDADCASSSSSSSSGGSLNSYFLEVEREKNLKKEKEMLKIKEEVFGQVYLSFFPVLW